MSAVLRAEADSLTWVPLKSSNLVAVAYSDAFSRLFVKFKDGKIYAYFAVPRPIFEAFAYAPSAGTYLWSTVRAKGTDSVYAYQKL